MKTIKHLLPLIAVILNCIAMQSLTAQGLKGQTLADSLLNELPKTKSDTDQVKLLIRVTKAFLLIEPHTAMNYADSAMHLAQHHKWEKGIGIAYINKARIYRATSDYVDGLENAGKAYEIFKSLNWKAGMGDALCEIANNYERLGNYSKSLENNFTALAIYEDIGLDPSIASVYNSLGINYYRLKDYSKAIENYTKSLEIHKRTNNKFGIGSALDNIASVYLDQDSLKKANEYNQKGIELFEEINDQPAMARIYLNRGNLMQQQKDFAGALQFYNKARVINTKLDIKSSLAYDNGGIAGLYLTLAKDGTGKYIIPDSLKLGKQLLLQKAHNYFTTALELSKKTGELFLIADFTKSLSEIETMRGNYKNALRLYQESVKYKDSIFNDENKKKVAALENQRLTEVKDKEIQLLNKDKALQASEIKRQTFIRNTVIVAAVLAAILTFFLIRSFIRRRKIIFDKQVLQTEMKALRAQMNPHFIFNSLHSINKYVVENDKQNASDYLSKFAKLMRLVLENSREQEVPLENDLAALELYMQLESLRFQNRFQYKIEIGPGIDKENTLIPPLMLQPFAENAILHGMKDRENGLIKINIQPGDDNMIRCIVEDNGTGRKASLLTDQFVDKKRKSLGLKIMEERLNIINQLKKAKAAVQIFDLKDAENKPGGLRVELLLPLQLAF